MKKIILSVFCLTLLFYFSGCSNKNKNKTNYLNYAIAVELENLDENYDDETLKAMSVILRTNYKLENNQFQNSFSPNKKYLGIVYQTNNETLNDNNNKLIKINFDKNETISWQKNIKKSELLEYAKNNNISLTSISDIQPIYNHDKVKSINIGNTNFDYKSFANNFSLNSNKIDKIENFKDKITIYGNDNSFYDNFSIKKSKQLSNNNYNYKAILKDFYSDLKVI